MLNRKGMTLVESLFAFEIFITVLIVFVTLMSSLMRQEVRLSEYYELILKKEGDVLYQDGFIENIEMVLH